MGQSAKSRWLSSEKGRAYCAASRLSRFRILPERLALHQLGNPELSRETLYREAQKIRGQHNSLSDLRSCANALKYGRSIRDYSGGKFTTIATSTGIDPNDRTTWKIGGYDLVEVAHRAFRNAQQNSRIKRA
jgi:hypothetical protein